MRVPALMLLIATIACGAWLSARSEERLRTAKPQANDAGNEKKEESKKASDNAVGVADEPVKSIVSGKVIPLVEALKQRGIKTYSEEIKEQFVLVTRTGEILPIVPDWRGRAFYQDERLRNRPVDLVVNRRKGVPWLQVLSIYVFDENEVRSVMDYWCDICAIPMYEIKECECCQGPTRLRLRPQELPRDIEKAK
jgi:hypothetical protein